MPGRGISEPAAAEITALLRDPPDGGAVDWEQVVPLVHRELHRIASGYMRRERAGHTLQPTALVHEAYLRMTAQSLPGFESRDHFYAVAAQVMRQILVDYARKRKAGKRGGEARPVTLGAAEGLADRTAELLALDEALGELGRFDGRKARVLEWSYFGGLGEGEIGAVLGVSERTVRRDLRIGEAWLRAYLEGR